MDEDFFEEFMKMRMKEISQDLLDLDNEDDDEKNEKFKWIARGMLAGYTQCLNSYISTKKCGGE